VSFFLVVASTSAPKAQIVIAETKCTNVYNNKPYAKMSFEAHLEVAKECQLHDPTSNHPTSLGTPAFPSTTIMTSMGTY
jgi:hypothetical protein